MSNSQPFLTDVKTLRERARQHIEQGAVTAGYNADRETVLKLLNEALATEIVCTLRYKRHYYMADGLNASIAADEFLEHAQQEQQHAERAPVARAAREAHGPRLDLLLLRLLAFVAPALWLLRGVGEVHLQAVVRLRVEQHVPQARHRQRALLPGLLVVHEHERGAAVDHCSLRALCRPQLNSVR